MLALSFSYHLAYFQITNRRINIFHHSLYDVRLIAWAKTDKIKLKKRNTVNLGGERDRVAKAFKKNGGNDVYNKWQSIVIVRFVALCMCMLIFIMWREKKIKWQTIVKLWKFGGQIHFANDVIKVNRWSYSYDGNQFDVSRLKMCGNENSSRCRMKFEFWPPGEVKLIKPKDKCVPGG